jgi:hypothetical protein
VALSKSAAAVFPVLLALTDYYRGRRLRGPALLEKIPFFAVAIAIGAVTLGLRHDLVVGEIAHFVAHRPERLVEAAIADRRLGVAAHQLD